MTPDQARTIAAEYERIETNQNKMPRGADPEGIIQILAAKYLGDGVTVANIRKAVLDNVFTKPV